jgi:hypothetical protein
MRVKEGEVKSLPFFLFFGLWMPEYDLTDTVTAGEDSFLYSSVERFCQKV